MEFYLSILHVSILHSYIMQLYKFVSGVLLLMTVTCGHVSAQDVELGRVKQNFIRLIETDGNEHEQLNAVLKDLPREESASDQMVVELFQRQPSPQASIRKYLSEQTAEGTWPDIDYQDRKPSGWEPRVHTERILELAKQYASPQSPYYRSAQVEACIHKALRWWFATKPVCPNWWYNQIGVPKTLGNAFLLFEPQLTADERQGAIEVMEHARFGMTGQNKVWLVGNVLVRALLQEDKELARQARDTIASEIVTGQSEGIQPDWSYHQHGTQQQFGNYGLAFLASMSFYSGVFAGTSMAFDDHQLEILRRLTDEGYRWILWKGKMDISALGRQFFREGQTHKGLVTAFAATELGGGTSKACNETAYALCRENFQPDVKNGLTGHKHFFCSNYTVHRRPTWMASVKMASRRVIGAETMNGDNMKGFYSADGATYIYQDGNEYLDIFPLWDWRKLPGVTAFDTDAPMPIVKGNRPRNNSDFVGGLSDGRQGMSVMDLDRAGLRACKAWIFTDDFVLCLGAGIQTDSTLTVTTAIEQCYRRGDLSVLLPGQRWKTAEGSVTTNGREVRFHHNSMGYIAWGDNLKATATAERRTGDWHDIMQMYPEGTTADGDVVQLCLSHGTAPKDASYQYVILPDADRRQTEAFDLDAIRVLRNDRTVQAVLLADGTCWLAASEPASLTLPDGTAVETATPGIYQIAKEADGRYTALWTSPSRRHEQAGLSIGTQTLKLTDTYHYINNE